MPKDLTSEQLAEAMKLYPNIKAVFAKLDQMAIEAGWTPMGVGLDSFSRESSSLLPGGTSLTFKIE